MLGKGLGAEAQQHFLFANLRQQRRRKAEVPPQTVPRLDTVGTIPLPVPPAFERVKVLASKALPRRIQAKRKETAMGAVPRAVRGLRNTSCANHHEFKSTSAPPWGLHGTVGLQLRVLPEDLCHKGGHVSLFGVV